MDTASISGSSGSLPEPADVGLGLHKRGRGTSKAAGLAEEPEDLPIFGKGGKCNVCSGDYYGDCDFYSVKVAPAACPTGAPFAGYWPGHACCGGCRGDHDLCTITVELASCLPKTACLAVSHGLSRRGFRRV